MNAPISAEQQINYLLINLQAIAECKPYPGQLNDIREQLALALNLFALYQRGELAPIPTQGDQEVQENVR